MKLPEVIKKNIADLDALAEQYPVSIPVPVVAEFLGMDRDGLRRCIENGSCPFGIAWQKTISGKRSFKIMTTPFYMWYTKCGA